MAEIRDFSSRRPVANQKNYNKKIAWHRLFKASRLISFLVITVCIVIAVIIWLNNRIYTTYNIYSEVDWSVTDQSKVSFLGDMIFTYSMDGAKCVDLNGKQIWNQTFQMQKPIVDICENFVAIGEYNGNDVYIMNDEEIIGNFSTGLPITNICVSENGYVAATLKDNDVTWIYLYNQTGEKVADFKTTMEKSGYPISIDISNNGTLVAVSYLMPEIGDYQSNVAFFNFSSVGSERPNNLVSSYTYNTSAKIIPYLRFANSELSFAVGYGALMSYQSAQIPEEVFQTTFNQEILSVFSGKEYIGVVLAADSVEGAYQLQIFDVDGMVCTHDFDMSYKGILFHDNEFIIYNEQQCEIYSMNDVLKFEATFEEPIIQMKMIDGKAKGTMLTTDKIYQFTLE